MMMRCDRLRGLACAAAATLLFVVNVLAESSVRDLYERARLLDESNQNLPEAIRLYESVIAQGKGHRALAARAQYRIGILHERMGRRDDAQQAFRKVVRLYADQTAIAGKARAKIDSASSESSPAPLIRKTGPSADGSYFETWTLSSSANLLPVVDPERHRLYVMTSRYSSQATSNATQDVTDYEPSTLIVIDTRTQALLRTVPLTVYGDHLVLNAANGRLYVTAQADGHVRVIEPTGFVQSVIAVPGRPTGIAVNPLTNRIYVTSQGFGGNDKLFVIDGSTDTVAGRQDLDGVAGEVVINTATNQVFCPTIAPAKTRVFNGATLSMVTDLNGTGVLHVDAGRNMLFAQSGTDGLHALSGSSFERVAAYGPSSPTPAFSSDPAINRIYVTHGERDQLAVIDAIGYQEAGRFLLPGAPHNLVVDSATGHVYICHRGETPTIGVLDGRGIEWKIPQEFADEFEAKELDASWAMLAGQGRHSLTERPGQLRFHVGRLARSKPRLLLSRRFGGDHWTLELKAAYFTGTTGGSRNLSFGIHLGVSPRACIPGTSVRPLPLYVLQIVRSRDDWNGCCPGELRQVFLEGGRVVATSLLPLSPGDDYVWRIRRAGRTIRVERSNDGNEYVLVGAYTFGPRVDGVSACLALGFDSFADSEAFADYDYVRLKPGPR